ncbi:putative ORF C (apicoplast) [Besnoitia besnoiti]|uniref:Putative ORF C n=1 Tax=Besnoitia besnoiti TaxID=94643 RepID=A0A2A9M033_BESBE|nr:putative ORF C [Besnoitia besnoiti]PFH30584.1 putative ORF C [Besnoitia besnoiti]
MLKKIKFFYKKTTHFISKSYKHKKIGFYIIKKKIYIFKVKKFLQNIKIGNFFTKKICYRLLYCLKKLYNNYI